MNEDISWHRHEGPESEHAVEGLSGGGILLFGRKTYEMMSSFWPTPTAMDSMPEIAKGMNNAEKIVFSRTLKDAKWNNTRIISDNIVEKVRKLKVSGSKDMKYLEAADILQKDEMSNRRPVVIGEGSSVLENITKKLDLKLTKSKVYKSGVILAIYDPLE